LRNRSHELRLRKALKSKILGKRIYSFRELKSTNAFAMDLARKGSAEGAIVIAEVQSEGRGRLGRKWFSPSGGLWLSIIFRPKVSSVPAPRMTVIGALGVVRAVRRLWDCQAFLKWPNDVLLGPALKKVCGILTETGVEGSSLSYVVMGIGINVNVDVEKFPVEFRKTVTSLQKEAGHRIDRIEFAARLLEEIEELYLLFHQKGFAPILREWKKVSGTLGRKISVALSGTRIIKGKAVDIDSEGALIVETEEGKQERILAGDVTLV
jgi:BirA family biotin operon repressor/biotin-[acetyl-CoA-carboxylase] ligase